MHNIAVFRIAAQKIGHNFTKSFWEKPFVDVFNGIMNVLFRSRNTPEVISVVGTHIENQWFEKNLKLIRLPGSDGAKVTIIHEFAFIHLRIMWCLRLLASGFWQLTSGYCQLVLSKQKINFAIPLQSKYGR
jgi:hypothetical protein